MLRQIGGNKGSELLVDLVVLMMFVHSSYIVEDVFVNHGP